MRAQIQALDERIEPLVESCAEARVLTVPEVAPVTAAVFLGSIGDPKTYQTKQQVLKVAGLSLIERSSGTRSGELHISKRGRPILRRSAYIPPAPPVY